MKYSYIGVVAAAAVALVAAQPGDPDQYHQCQSGMISSCMHTQCKINIVANISLRYIQVVGLVGPDQQHAHPIQPAQQ